MIEKQNKLEFHNKYKTLIKIDNYFEENMIDTIYTDEPKNTFISFLPIYYHYNDENELIGCNFDETLNKKYNEELIKLGIVKDIKIKTDRIIITFHHYFLKYCFVVSTSTKNNIKINYKKFETNKKIVPYIMFKKKKIRFTDHNGNDVIYKHQDNGISSLIFYKFSLI